MSDVLVLNADYRPKGVVNWMDAIGLILRGAVRIEAEYDDWTVSSPSCSMNVPAVLVLKTYVNQYRKVRFNRTNVYVRDDFRCQYCGEGVKHGGMKISDLTFDHVVPRSHGGKTEWTNIVTSCEPCNKAKADRTPKQAGMPLLAKPKAPHAYTDVEFQLRGREVPDKWQDYLDLDRLQSA